MTDKNYQICTSCVMDTTDSAIIFDDQGVCDHCNTFKNVTLPSWDTGKRGYAQLATLVDTIKRDGEGKDFDCIIGMSGGIDSSYLTYLAKEKMGLRPLVFHVDAGWNSQIAVNNIERLIVGLGLDLYTEVIDWQEMRDLQLSFFRSGVPHIDTPQDHAFFATMYKFATKYNVKYILTGANLSTECIRNPIEWMYYQSDSRQLRDIHRRFGKVQLKSFPVTSILWHKVWLPEGGDIKTPLAHGDLLQSSVGQRHGGLALSIARSIWPRWFIRRFFRSLARNQKSRTAYRPQPKTWHPITAPYVSREAWIIQSLLDLDFRPIPFLIHA